MRLAVIGQGYVGQAVGLAARSASLNVIGIETDSKKVKKLTHLGYPVCSDFSEVNSANVVIIAVPTPLNDKYTPDLSYLHGACMSIRPHLTPQTLIINESTSYPGTLRNLILPILGDSHLYASAPERIDPGNPKWNIQNTPRVVGGLTEEAAELAVNFYMSITNEVIKVSTPEIAEASKLLENTFRQVNIALVNEFSRILKALKIPAMDTIEAASTKPFGFMKFLPSIGVGGHCIPVDPIYFSYAASEIGEKAELINLASHLNRLRPIEVARQIHEEFLLTGKKVQVAGISYKSNSADVRETPVIPFINELRRLGATVLWYDPLVQSYENETSSELTDVDLGIICNPHNGINFDYWKKKNCRIIDLSTSSDLGFGKYF
jgi:UDP-N-acetyl-D-glucosamine dehydrogenase